MVRVEKLQGGVLLLKVGWDSQAESSCPKEKVKAKLPAVAARVVAHNWLGHTWKVTHRIKSTKESRQPACLRLVADLLSQKRGLATASSDKTTRQDDGLVGIKTSRARAEQVSAE